MSQKKSKIKRIIKSKKALTKGFFTGSEELDRQQDDNNLLSNLLSHKLATLCNLGYKCLL